MCNCSSGRASPSAPAAATSSRVFKRSARRLDRGTLTIHPRCVRLIEAMTRYHFDPDHPRKEEPVKDGPDHLCDALRYLIVNLETSGVTVRRY